MQALQGQRAVHVDLHDDLGGGVEPFGRIVDRRRRDDVPLLGQPHRLDHHHVDGAVPPPLHLERKRRPLALDEPHLPAIDGGPELLPAHRADPRPDPPRLGEDVLHLAAQRPGAQEVDLEAALGLDPLRQRLERGLRETHGAPRRRDHHPVPEEQGRLVGRHDLREGFLMFDPCFDSFHRYLFSPCLTFSRMKVEISSSFAWEGNTPFTPVLLQYGDVVLRDRPPEQHQNVLELPLLDPLHQLPGDRDVRPRQDAHPDHVHRLLERHLHHLLHALPKPGVDHLHPLVPEPEDQHLRPDIVPVQSDLGDQHPYRLLRLHETLPISCCRLFKNVQMQGPRFEELSTRSEIIRRIVERSVTNPEPWRFCKTCGFFR